MMLPNHGDAEVPAAFGGVDTTHIHEKRLVPHMTPDGRWVNCQGEEIPDPTDIRILTSEEVGLSFDAYQSTAHSFAKYADRMEMTPELREAATFLYPSSKLAGEAGEVSEKLAKLLRDQGIWRWKDIPAENKETLIKELGDVLWYVAEIATKLGVKLSEVAQKNCAKLAGRVERGTLLGSGDDR